MHDCRFIQYFPNTMVPTDKDGYPTKSGLAGTIIDEVGEPGGLFNDHYWSLIDIWTAQIMDRVRVAGTYYTYIAT